MPKKDIVIVGARGLGKEVLSYIEEHGGYRAICILDELDIQDLFGVEVVHPDRYSSSCKNALFAIGYPEYKGLILSKYLKLDLVWETFIHPTSTVSKYASIGTGVIIAPYVLVSGNAIISDFVFMNAYSAAGHDSVVGMRSSLMPYSCVTGGGKIGNDCLLATGAKILPEVSIGDHCRVSAGAVVMHSMPADSLISGNPAKSQPDIMMLRRRRRKMEEC